MALQLALIEKVNTDGQDVFLISTKGLGDVSNRAVAVLFDMAQDLICKPLPWLSLIWRLRVCSHFWGAMTAVVI